MHAHEPYILENITFRKLDLSIQLGDPWKRASHKFARFPLPVRPKGNP